MKEFGNQEFGEKMSWKGFASELMQPDAPGLKLLLSKRETPESELSILFIN